MLKRAVEVASILLVDDEPAIRRIMETILLTLGEHDVRHADRGADALRALQAAPPDLMILDVRLPDANGLELFRSARMLGYRGPVLMMTAIAPSDPALKPIRDEVGADALLLKPFDIDEFSDRVLRALEVPAARAD